MTSRDGGVSQPPYASMNLGDHVQDDAQAVAHNRRQLAQATGGAQPVFLQQVHGVGVARLGADAPAYDPPLQADACLSTAAGVACTIMVADCLPVLLTHKTQRMTGAAHAGWRGLAGHGGSGVLEQLVHHMRQAAPQAAMDGWLAWLGPCIGPSAFEVGDEVRHAFVAHSTQAHACFEPAPQSGQSGKWLADLAGLARQRLAALGVQAVYGNDSTALWCTYGNAARYYSYRREARTGRMAAAVWLRPD